MLQWLPEKSAPTWDGEVTVCGGTLPTQALNSAVSHQHTRGGS